MSLGVKQSSTVRRAQFVPSGFKELPHTVACLTDGAVVFIERLAVVEDLPDICAKFFPRFITETNKYMADAWQYNITNIALTVNPVISS